jgi:hypothetical protein
VSAARAATTLTVTAAATAGRLVLVLGCLALGAGCHEGSGLGLPPAGGPDLASAPVAFDLAPPPDLTPQKSCGEVVTCALGCGTAGLQCLPGCITGASPEAQQEGIALITCAAQNCLQLLAGDAGTGGIAQIFQCLLQNCQTELAGCKGLAGL